ncbi:DEAD-domain-containing protein [Calocera viscosa TUFC12733]|uniref:RNA helicase n=1 Tax=Calocera viscosa (strain TUFC12733) TaxID=1330018 RepID=A0A167HWB8_CALVF|nr:DEAD-domain-containing protein [Calocera viscosa TUFC12733]
MVHPRPVPPPAQKRIKNKDKYLPKGNKERKRKEAEEERARALREKILGVGSLEHEGEGEGEQEGQGEAPGEEERQRKKEEKRKAKELRRAARASEAPVSAEAPEPELERKKKRAHPPVDIDAEVPAAAAAAADDSEERPKKKRKKDRSLTGLVTPASGSTTLASTPAPAPSSTTSSAADLAYLSKHHITLSHPLPPLLSLPSLPIAPPLLAALAHFSEPTPIQACAWPALLAGRDVVGIAETGSGKTLAFGVPALQRLVDAGFGAKAGKDKGGKDKDKARSGKGQAKVDVLVVAPTRELALQTHNTLLSLSSPFGLTSVCLYGGVPKTSQLSELAHAGARIVVGTPGRVLDLAREGALDLSNVGFLVLDEADRMLDRGFEPDIRAIVDMTRKEGRQTAMFSATWPESVRRLAATFQRDPFRITVGAEDLSANKRVAQSVEVLTSYDKDSRLRTLLQGLKHSTKGAKAEEERTLVFVLYKKEATRVEQALARSGYRVGAIHGDMGQQARIAALDEFKSGRTKLLVATDVAARGLDIPNVGTVINYSFPLTIEDYIHRIGRTGRGGLSGKSVTFFTGEGHERALAGELMRVLRDADCEVPAEMSRFPNTIKKKEHSVYGAFYRDDIPMDAKPKKITFD